MGFIHIPNLYKDQLILELKECYALEKIHGTSAHIKFHEDGTITFFSGGEKHDRFVQLFDEEKLKSIYNERYAGSEITIFGEAYGGKQQGMSATYGQELKFIAFDVKVGNSWLDVPNAFDVASKLGLEFVDFVKIPTTLEAIDAERDKPSTQAKRNGIIEDKPREGVVLRPTFEITLNNGSRLIVKHKRDEFRETATPRKIADPAKLEVLKEAEHIAEEWVTAERLRHVLDKIPDNKDMSKTPLVIRAMQEDVLREAEGEIVPSKEAISAISKKTAVMFKQYVTALN